MGNFNRRGDCYPYDDLIPFASHEITTTYRFCGQCGSDYRVSDPYLCPPKEAPAVTAKPELTPLGHIGSVSKMALVVFAALGGVTGAVVGDVQAWVHLPWLYALYITIALASIAVGLFLHLDG